MTRNIMTGEGERVPVEAVTEFDVSGIKLFTHIDDWGDWRATEYSSGFALDFGHDNEQKAIDCAKSIIANNGPEKIKQRTRAIIDRCGVANEGAMQ